MFFFDPSIRCGFAQFQGILTIHDGVEKGGRDELDIFKEYFVELRERDESDERKENDENWSMAIAKNDIKISKVPNKSNTFHFKS